MNRKLWMTLLLLTFSRLLFAQQKPPPIIDVHLHAMPVKGSAPAYIGAPFRDLGIQDPKVDYKETYTSALVTKAWADRQLLAPVNNDSLQAQTLAMLCKYNIYAFTGGDIRTIMQWKQKAGDRIIPSIEWNFGIAQNDGLTVDSLEKLFRSGAFKMFGEIAIQYGGYTASDSAFEPYLAMAERLDIPVGIHVGPGPPGAPYLNTEKYRARFHSPLGLEEALIRHPKLRVFAMHAGWPMLDEMIATLYTHPQLYVDVAAICYMIPRKEFYYYLQRLVNAGFEKRIMFGSDNMIWPQAIEAGIQSIQDAPFLSAPQKRDIFFNNAARFFRFTKEEIAAMY